MATGMPDGMDSSGTSTPTDATTYAAGQNSVQVPANASATAISDTRIELSWAAVPGAATYYVFRAEGAGSYAYITSVPAPTTSSLQTDLASNTQYSFAIGVAMPDGRESSNTSTPVSATTLPSSQNNAQTPGNVTATVTSDSRIETSWDAVSGAAKYYVFRAEGAGAMQYIGTATAPTTLWQSSGLAASTQYSFAIATVMEDGTESAGASTPVSVTTFSSTVAPVPADVAATAVSSSRIEVSWSAVAGAVKYYVFRSEAGGAFAYVTTATDAAHHSTGLAPSTEYAFEIVAVMADDTESAASAQASATTLPAE
ncbi:MAG: fibronectin type III domain-containing protein [Kofleriaceae bacterium]